MIFKTRPNYSASLDGVNEYVKGGNSSPYNFEWTDSFTVGAWVKPDLTTNEFPIAGKFFNETGWNLLIRSTGRVQSRHITGSFVAGRAMQNYTSTGVITSGELTHIVMTYDGTGTSSGTKIYVNGEFISWDITGADLTSGTMVSTSSVFEMGSITGLSWYSEGELYDIRVWDKVLSATEIKNEHNYGSSIQEVPSATANLIGHCTFGEDYTWDGSNITFTDESGTYVNGYVSTNMDLSNLNEIIS
jgi:hypothetical protein